jgi:hypothetical protein
MQKAVDRAKARAAESATYAFGLPDKAKARAAESATYVFELTKKAIFHSIIGAITSGLILNSSIFMYATFYYAFVPAPEHEGRVLPNRIKNHFQKNKIILQIYYQTLTEVKLHHFQKKVSEND